MKIKLPDRTTLFLILVALILAGVAWGQGGFEQVLEGLLAGGRTLWSVTPLLLAAFIVAGLTQALVSRQTIEHWLGRSAGWRGILLACLGGALIPGGPYVYYPIAGALLKSGAGLGVLVSFVVAKNLWSISRIPYEVALLGPRLTFIRFGLTLIVPPLLGLISEALFGGRIEQIREGVS